MTHGAGAGAGVPVPSWRMDGWQQASDDRLSPPLGTRHSDHVPCWTLLRCHDKPPNVQQNTNTSWYKLEIKEIRRVTTGNNMSRCPLQRCSVVILRSGWVDCRLVNQPSQYPLKASTRTLSLLIALLKSNKTLCKQEFKHGK